MALIAVCKRTIRLAFLGIGVGVSVKWLRRSLNDIAPRAEGSSGVCSMAGASGIRDSGS